jgi:hypothetical protein
MQAYVARRSFPPDRRLLARRMPSLNGISLTL